MPAIEYVKKKFSVGSKQIIAHANSIIAEYEAAGYSLTLRQLYYQFVSRDLIPNRQSEYKRFGSIIGDARLAGLIDWDALEDRGRNLTKSPTWSGPEDIIESCAHQFKLDLWQDQDHHVEVWIEKEALIGVVERTCRDLRIGAFACKGYVSLSEMWDAGYNRLRRHTRDGKSVVILHFGDHDPSGIDMTRDIRDRLSLLSGSQDIEIVRIALNEDQIQQYNPPPNPAKVTDSRFAAYEAKYGDESWELDALPPDVLDALIREHIEEYRDSERFSLFKEQEDDARKTLLAISEKWDSVKSHVVSNGKKR